MVALVTSLPPSELNAAQWLEDNRAAWGIESGLHQRLDDLGLDYEVYGSEGTSEDIDDQKPDAKGEPKKAIEVTAAAAVTRFEKKVAITTGVIAAE